jgi:hypothetical protein
MLQLLEERLQRHHRYSKTPLSDDTMHPRLFRDPWTLLKISPWPYSYRILLHISIHNNGYQLLHRRMLPYKQLRPVIYQHLYLSLRTIRILDSNGSSRTCRADPRKGGRNLECSLMIVDQFFRRLAIHSHLLV